MMSFSVCLRPFNSEWVTWRQSDWASGWLWIVSAFRSFVRLKFHSYLNRNFFPLNLKDKKNAKRKTEYDELLFKFCEMYHWNWMRHVKKVKYIELFYFFLFIRSNVKWIERFLFGSRCFFMVVLFLCLSTVWSGSVRAKLLAFELRKMKKNRINIWRRKN